MVAVALAVVAIAPGGLIGCASSAEAEVGEPFELRPGESVSLSECEASIRFVSVENDSRCPSGVTCIWEGDAEVMLTATRDARTTSIQLHTNQRSGRAAAAMGGGCNVELVALAPVPDQSGRIPAAAYIATLLVREGNGR